MVKVDFKLDGVKIPKRVGGVKVPKQLRKQGKKLIAKANSPQGREAIAAGLTIAGTMLAAKARAKAERHAAQWAGEGPVGASPPPPVPPVPPVPPAPPRPGEPGIDPANELGDAIAAGIGALQRFLAGVRKD